MNAYDDSGTEFDDNEIDTDDETLDAADSSHEEERDEEEMLRTPIAREKRYNTITGPALSVPALNDNLVVDESDTPSRDDGTGRPSRANVKPEKAKEQRRAAFGDAMKEWGTKLKQDDGMHVASGFKPRGKVAKPVAEESVKVEPWRIKVAIENGFIKGDKSRLNETLYQFFNDFNNAVDAFGIRASNVDHGIQKDPNGRLVFEGAMTYDRKQRAVQREDGQEENGSENRARQMTKQARERVEISYGKGYYDKKVAIPITDTGAVDCAGYNPGRGDLLLAERITDTKHRAEEVAVFVGPLLPELRKAVFENASATKIGESLGFEQPQASAVGNAMLQRALEAASDAYARIKKRERKGWTYSEWLAKQPDGMPIPARKLKQAYDKRPKIKAGIIAEVDQAIAHVGIVKVSNDNLPLSSSLHTTELAA
jgi:hypothetical protein